MLRLTKHHGLGNDFLVALADQNPDLEINPELARSICDRKLGIGADGLILSFPPSEEGNDACMVLLNADGSEAEISGNGIRCLGQALLRQDGRNEGDLRIETAGGVRQLRSIRGSAETEIWIQVDMGAATAGPPLGPLSQAYPALHRGTFNIGNPHLVLVLESEGQLQQLDLATVGQHLESEYAEGINVEFLYVHSTDHMQLLVWERGAGVTEACGSGATVAAAAAHSLGLVGEQVRVSMPGGDAQVAISDSTLLLTGPSVFIAEVTVFVPEVTVS
ncbi:MAG: diaminopimelate epimerase [Actinomycetes bacterium]